MRGEKVGEIGPEALQALHSRVDAYLALVVGYEICWVEMLQLLASMVRLLQGEEEDDEIGPEALQALHARVDAFLADRQAELGVKLDSMRTVKMGALLRNSKRCLLWHDGPLSISCTLQCSPDGHERTSMHAPSCAAASA